jgi:hypothetical protein
MLSAREQVQIKARDAIVLLRASRNMLDGREKPCGGCKRSTYRNVHEKRAQESLDASINKIERALRCLEG